MAGMEKATPTKPTVTREATAAASIASEMETRQPAHAGSGLGVAVELTI